MINYCRNCWNEFSQVDEFRTCKFCNKIYCADCINNYHQSSLEKCYVCLRHMCEWSINPFLSHDYKSICMDCMEKRCNCGGNIKYQCICADKVCINCRCLHIGANECSNCGRIVCDFDYDTVVDSCNECKLINEICVQN